MYYFLTQLLQRTIPASSIIVTLFYWIGSATHVWSLSVLFFLIGFMMFSLLTGDIFINLTIKTCPTMNNFSIRMLSGVIIISLFLFLFLLLFPYTIICDLQITGGLIIVAGLIFSRKSFKSILPAASIQEMFFIILALASITLWCQDSLRPLERRQEISFLMTWPDTFYHSGQIAHFANANTGQPLSDFLMSGTKITPYHYASYIIPAALVASCGTSAFAACTSFHLPLGMLLAALATFSLTSYIFGRWPAVFGSLIFLTLSDPLLQGFGNVFMYNGWMQQISVSLLYGVACATLAFLFLLQGCASSRISLIIIGFILVVITGLFKAHIFVAIAYPALIFPALFMSKIKIKWRIYYVLSMSIVYYFCISLSQEIPSLPYINYNGKELFGYSDWLLGHEHYGFFKTTIKTLFNISHRIWIFHAAVFSAMLLLCTFGLTILLYPWVAWQSRKNLCIHCWALPLIVIINFLIMSTCLNGDIHLVGGYVELLHRPYVWACYIVCPWTLSAGYFLFFKDELPRAKSLLIPLLLLLPLSLFVPWKMGHNIQSAPSLGWEGQHIPNGLADSAAYIKANSAPSDIIQDSRCDNNYMLTSLTERQLYVGDGGGYRQPLGLRMRMKSISTIMKETSSQSVIEFARRNSIKWFVLFPGDKVNWDNKLAPVFEKNGFKVYKF